MDQEVVGVWLLMVMEGGGSEYEGMSTHSLFREKESKKKREGKNILSWDTTMKNKSYENVYESR